MNIHTILMNKNHMVKQNLLRLHTCIFKFYIIIIL